MSEEVFFDKSVIVTPVTGDGVPPYTYQVLFDDNTTEDGIILNYMDKAGNEGTPIQLKVNHQY